MKAEIKKLLAKVSLLEAFLKACRVVLTGSAYPRAEAIKPARQRGAALVFKQSQIAVRKANRDIRLGPSGRGYVQSTIDYFDYHHSAVIPLFVAGLAIAAYSRFRRHRLAASSAMVDLLQQSAQNWPLIATRYANL